VKHLLAENLLKPVDISYAQEHDAYYSVIFTHARVQYLDADVSETPVLDELLRPGVEDRRACDRFDTRLVNL
jgi:hypothetical protein